MTEIITEYVKESFYWDGIYGKFSTQSPKSFYESKTGNDADINLFLLAMLRELDI